MFTDKVIDGGDILLSVGGQVIGCATSHTIEITNTVREISCKGSGDFASSEYGRFSWSVSVDALFNLYDDVNYLNYAELLDLMLSKTIVDIESTYKEGTDSFTIAGQAIITSVSKNAPDSENASYSIQMSGRGKLAITGTNIIDVHVVAAVSTPNPTYVFVEETGRRIMYETGGVTFKLTEGTWHIVGYNDSDQIDRQAAVVVDTPIAVTLDLS